MLAKTVLLYFFSSFTNRSRSLYLDFPSCSIIAIRYSKENILNCFPCTVTSFELLKASSVNLSPGTKNCIGLLSTNMYSFLVYALYFLIK